jgi:metallo-beta-lactamase class B
MPRRLRAICAALAAALAGVQARAQPAADNSPQVQEHVAEAVRLAGQDLTTPLFLCRANSWAVVQHEIETGQSQWLAPTRIFDNLAFVGNEFVGVLVVETSQGLILFDSTTSAEDAQHRLVPGLQALGLDPRTIRYVIVTHGHFDHFGGAAWLQKTYGARVGLSAADWDMIEHQPADAPGMGGHEAPRRDLVIHDGQKLILGDTTITLYVTPGHTPGAVSALLPAREGGRTHVLSLLGSVAFPPTLGPTPTAGGLVKYDQSIRRFGAISREAGATAIFNTHIFADGGSAKLAAAALRKPGDPNPFLIGADAVGRYYGLFDECLQAAIARAG